MFRLEKQPSDLDWQGLQETFQINVISHLLITKHFSRFKNNAICIGVHPGTVKTDLSIGFWESATRMEPFEPMDAASNLINVVENLAANQRGKL